MKNLATIILSILLFQILPANAQQVEDIVVKPGAYENALRNPLKGFTTNSIKAHPWASTAHVYIKWNELENLESDGFDKILQVSNSKFGSVASQNKKVIPRVYLHWDGDKKYWPADMLEDDYTSQQFQQRVLRLIKRLGAAWDNDPRIAFVELGIFGKWGEQHSPSPTLEMQKLVGNAFAEAFKNKKVSVRRNWQYFTDHEFGEYWDSWAHYDQMWGHGKQIARLNDQGRYLDTYNGGEVAYGWGDSDIQPGPSPTHSVALEIHRDFVINSIRWLHCTQLRWIGGYDKYNTDAVAGAEEMQKAFGYRYEIEEVRFSITDSLNIAFDVINTGSAPFYYDWPVEVALLDVNTHEPVWKRNMARADIRKWFPGSGWTEPDWVASNDWAEYHPVVEYTNEDTTGWAVPPSINTVKESFKVDAPDGTYLIAFAVLDPAGNLPSLRFATSNYIRGGRHPFGLVAVGTNECTPLPGDFLFDDPATDNSLYYDDAFEVTVELDPVQKPFKDKAWFLPSDSVQAWQYDYMFNNTNNITFALDSGATIGIYGCEDTTGYNIRSYVDADQMSDAAQFKWDTSALTFQKNGQWLKYAVNFQLQIPYQVLIRARNSSDANFKLKIFTIHGDTVFSRDNNLKNDFQNIGGGNETTDWYLSKFGLNDLSGNHIVLFDWYDQVGDPGMFGCFSFKESVIDATPPVWYFTTVGNIEIGDVIRVMTDEDGIVYLVPSGTSADTASIKIGAVANIPVEAYVEATIETSDLEADEFVLYAMDQAMNVSEASKIITIEATVDTSDIDTITTVIAFPNPEINIQFNITTQSIRIKSSSELTAVNVYNISGTNIRRLRPDARELSIPTEDFEKGIYLVQVVGRFGNTETTKFIKK